MAVTITMLEAALVPKPSLADRSVNPDASAPECEVLVADRAANPAATGNGTRSAPESRLRDMYP